MKVVAGTRVATDEVEVVVVTTEVEVAGMTMASGVVVEGTMIATEVVVAGMTVGT